MIELHTSIPHHHEGNPRAERGIGIVRLILNVLNEKGGEWASECRKVAFDYRNTVNKSTGETPFFLMYGRKCPNSWVNGIMPLKKHNIPFKEMNQLREDAIKRINENKEQKRQFSTTESSRIKEGDLVLLKVKDRQSKDLPRYDKLCRVVGVDCIRKGGLILKPIKGHRRELVRHINDVKKVPNTYYNKGL